MYIYLCIYVYMYMYVYVCIHVCMYVNVYEHVLGSLNKFPNFFHMGTFIDSSHMKL